MKNDPAAQYERFCRLLVKCRKKVGVSQEAVAEKLGRRQAYVSKCERGMRRMNFIEFIEMAHAVGYDPCDFIKEFESSKKI